MPQESTQNFGALIRKWVQNFHYFVFFFLSMATACNCGLAEKLQQAEDKIRDLEEKIIILNPVSF